MVSKQVIGANSVVQLRDGKFENKPFFKTIVSETLNYSGSGRGSRQSRDYNPIGKMKEMVKEIGKNMTVGKPIPKRTINAFCNHLFAEHSGKEGDTIVNRAHLLFELFNLAKRKPSGSGDIQVEYLERSYPYHGNLIQIDFKPDRGASKSAVIIEGYGGQPCVIEFDIKNKKIEDSVHGGVHFEAYSFASVLNEMILPYLLTNEFPKK